MTTNIRAFTPFSLVIALFASPTLFADIELDTLFQRHAVVQRDRPIPVRGTTAPNVEVTVSLGDVSANGLSDDAGRFTVILPAMKASKDPRELIVRTAIDQLRLDDILVGEVWFCTGQSNMEWTVAGAIDADQARTIASTLAIRGFKAPHVTANTPQERVDGEWRLARGDTVDGFTAVGFWFAVDLAQALDVPIGLVDLSWGGTRIEPWIPLDALQSAPAFKQAADGMAKRIVEHASLSEETKAARMKMYNSAYNIACEKYWSAVLDGELGMSEGFDEPVSSSGWPALWQTTTLPIAFSKLSPELAQYDGTVWFTREFDVPTDMARRACRIELGAIDDSDIVWCVEGRAGSIVGAPGTPRSYSVIRGLPAGKQRISVCVLDTGGEGGFMSEPASMRIVLADEPKSIALAGEWQWRKGSAVKAVEAPVRGDPLSKPGVQSSDPAAMYNAMIAPCIQFPARGSIWYQGESNAGEPDKYRMLLPLLMNSWRIKSGNPDLAWGVVQLAGFMQFAEHAPAEGAWALLREAQFRGAAQGNGGMVSAIDLGDANDIHPRRKREVGDRLAAWALATVYHDGAANSSSAVQWHGPELVQATRDGARVVCEFAYCDGLRAAAGELGGFAVAGADGKFAWANASIVGVGASARVVVECATVSDPVELVYAWQNNPERANLVNSAGLPAVPFRVTVVVPSK